MLSARAVQLNIDGHYFPAKTPARNTKSRGENAYQGTMTVQNAKGKASVMRTPFQPKTAQPQRHLKEAPGSTAKAPIILVTRPNKPLADKTPFANRVMNTFNTPATNIKPPKLNFPNPTITEQPGATPESNPGSARASSTRKYARTPKPTVNFQTPANQGNHWDVSDGDIVVPEMEQVLEIEEEFDELEEIEYMPPNTLDLPYHPPFDFDLPNYTLLGQAALRSVFSFAHDELPPPAFDFEFSDLDLMKWDSLPLRSLDSEDESASKPGKRTAIKSSTTIAKPTTTSRATSSLANNTRAISRPTTSVSLRRPATSTSEKGPSAKLAAARSVTSKPTRPVSSMTARPVTSTVTRAGPSTTAKPSTTATSRTNGTSRPQPSTSAKPSIRSTMTKAATNTFAKPTSTRTPAPRPTVTRMPVPKPATSTAPRPATSASLRLATGRPAIAPRAASATSRKPPVPRLGRSAVTSTKPSSASAGIVGSKSSERLSKSKAKVTATEVLDTKKPEITNPTTRNDASRTKEAGNVADAGNFDDVANDPSTIDNIPVKQQEDVEKTDSPVDTHCVSEETEKDDQLGPECQEGVERTVIGEPRGSSCGPVHESAEREEPGVSESGAIDEIVKGYHVGGEGVADFGFGKESCEIVEKMEGLEVEMNDSESKAVGEELNDGNPEGSVL